MVVEWITGNEDITNRFRERALEIVLQKDVTETKTVPERYNIVDLIS